MLCLSRATSAPAAADGNRRVKWPEPITTKRKKNPNRKLTIVSPFVQEMIFNGIKKE